MATTTQRWALLADPAEDGTRLVRAYLLTSGMPTLDERMSRAWGEPPGIEKTDFAQAVDAEGQPMFRADGNPALVEVVVAIETPKWSEYEAAGAVLDPGGEWVEVPASAGLVGDDWRLAKDGKTWLPPVWMA